MIESFFRPPILQRDAHVEVHALPYSDYHDDNDDNDDDDDYNDDDNDDDEKLQNVMLIHSKAGPEHVRY